MANCVHVTLRKLIRSDLDNKTDFCERHGWQWHNWTLLWTDSTLRTLLRKKHPWPELHQAQALLLSERCHSPITQLWRISLDLQKPFPSEEGNNQTRIDLELKFWGLNLIKQTAYGQGRDNCRTQRSAARLLSGTTSLGNSLNSKFPATPRLTRYPLSKTRVLSPRLHCMLHRGEMAWVLPS